MIRHIHNSVIVCLLAIIAVGFAPFIPTAKAQTPLKFGWSAVTPHTADYDGDGHLDMGLYDSTKGTMYARNISGTELAFDLTIALPGFIVACADFDGDGKADPASYDTASGFLCAYLSAQGYQLGALPCAVGLATTKAVPADYDGDSKADMALYDAASGIWIIYPSASGYQPVSFILGGNGATAVPMDYDGDGKADPCVYNQNTGLWMVFCSASQYALSGIVYGGPGCAAAPADFDGDGKADPAVYCAALGAWGTLHSSSNYAPCVKLQGGPDCMPMPGNYYFTNRADYAVYNGANGCWSMAYNPVSTPQAGVSLGSTFFDGLVKGAGTSVGEAIAGWTLRKLFHHGEDPSDPHWEEEKQILDNMNQKLDELLTGQQIITNMLIQLADQLEYDKNEIEWFISQSAANNAIAIIESHFDQHGIDGYASFYQYDTNHPPTCTDIDTFANIVLGSTYNMKTAVDSIYRAIIPASGGNTNGVLRLWANTVKPGLTPDNLWDNFAALAYYFATMYNYQMKGAAMYVDASRVRGTSEWAMAATTVWITNDLMSMVQGEVDEFRAVTYDYIMSAINGGYNPLSTNNVLIVTNVQEVLATTEFFAHQWLAQEQRMFGTILTVDRPEILEYYNGMSTWWPVSGMRIYAGALTNLVTGRPYGHWDGATNAVSVDNRYVFIRCDFGKFAPPADGSPYIAYNSNMTEIGSCYVRNYDDNMNVITNSAVTNWFGHFYASPVNVERIRVPLEDSRWQNYTYDSVSYNHALPGHWNAWYNYGTSVAKSLTNKYTITCELSYDLLSHRGDIPSVMGIDPWIHAIGTPFTISNHTGRPLGVYAFVDVDNSYVEMKRYDVDCVRPQRAYPNQTWDCQNCGGVAFFVTNTGMGAWGALPAGTYTHISGHEYIDVVSTASVNCVAMTYGSVPSSIANAVLYVGGRFYINQHCYDRFGWAINPYKAYIDGTIQYKIKDIIITFY